MSRLSESENGQSDPSILRGDRLSDRHKPPAKHEGRSALDEEASDIKRIHALRRTGERPLSLGRSCQLLALPYKNLLGELLPNLHLLAAEHTASIRIAI